MPRLLKTTAFRLALLYAFIFSLLSMGGFGTIYLATIARLNTRIDEQLHLETEALLSRYRKQGFSEKTLRQLIHHSENPGNLDGVYFFRVVEKDFDSDPNAPPFIPNYLPVTLPLKEVFPHTSFRLNSNQMTRVLATPLSGGFRLLVGNQLDDEKALQEYFWQLMMLVLLVTFLLAVLCSLVLGRYTLYRIDSIGRTARYIMSGQFSKRIPLSKRRDEFFELSNQLNEMLEKIEDLMLVMRQVTDNIAHDLRKPLNRLRSRMEIALLEARTVDEYTDIMERGIEDIDELLKTFNALLSIAQAEAGVKRNEWTPVNINDLVTDLGELYEVLAEEDGLTFSMSARCPQHIMGNRQLLAQAVSNMLENAVKYTPSGGHIDLTCEITPGNEVVISVADNGPGIPPDQFQKVLKRFVRLDSARTNPGNGLGLSLVKAVTKLHRGYLRLEDNQPGFRISLFLPIPLMAPQQPSSQPTTSSN